MKEYEKKMGIFVLKIAERDYLSAAIVIPKEELSVNLGFGNKDDDVNDEFGSAVFLLKKPLQIIYNHGKSLELAPAIHFAKYDMVAVSALDVVWAEEASEEGKENYTKWSNVYYPDNEESEIKH